MARDDDDLDTPRERRPATQESKRILAGILAIVLGGFGIHKFILGYTVPGIIMLVLACTGISGIIGLVEGIIYLTKSDEEFVETYQIGKKEWF
jgi:TM2 domain-containing membrane protein YozV